MSWFQSQYGFTLVALNSKYYKNAIQSYFSTLILLLTQTNKNSSADRSGWKENAALMHIYVCKNILLMIERKFKDHSLQALYHHSKNIVYWVISLR